MQGSKGKHACFMQRVEVSKELSSAQPKPGLFSCPDISEFLLLRIRDFWCPRD